MDNEVVNLEKAKEILDGGLEKANALLKDNEQIKEVVETVQEKIDSVPILKSTVADLPVMVSMVKSYVKKEYEVSPKVVATIVSAFLYLVKRKDLIPDSLPILGQLDDVAVIALALKFVQPEIKAYASWKENQQA
ncbi:MAG: DUF1232 domain-containing protein [Erysipelotrichaceae bacterium]|nr:DUF1232 domain-containing protein [Erysipelotrichaceae bacterium]